MLCRNRILARLAPGLVVLALAGTVAADGLPDYIKESELLVDTPGTTGSVAGGLFNPASWVVQRRGGLFLAWNDGAGNLTRDDFTGVASVRGLSFGMRQFKLEPTAGDVFRVRDYVVGLGLGTRGSALGLSYAWGGGDLDRAARHERFGIGAVTRLRPASLGLSWTRDLEVDDNFLQADLGIRPLGPRFTLFGDAVYEHGQSFEDIVSGYGAEIRPIPGLALAVKARSTGEIGLRVNMALGTTADLSFRPQLDDDGERSAATYALELGGPFPSLGHGPARHARAYPTLDLKGPMAYQRHAFFDKRRTLLDALRRIESIADDPSAAGVVVNLSGAQIGTEMLWEIREQLAGLRARGKKVIVYVDRAGMSGYMLATVADQIWMDPAGMLDLRGLALSRTYMMHALDKLGLGVDEWRFFTYKSAFETYSRDSMSEPDREQRQDLVDDMYEEMAVAVTTTRGLTRAAWDSLVDNQGIFLPEDARAAGLVDAIGSFETARETAGRAPARTRPDASSAVLAGVTGEPVWSPIEWGTPPRIAVLYAIGPCEMDRGIRGRTLARAIKQAREDRSVVAVVLRADSPGGDGLPSDLVAREMIETAKRKPVIVSQGQVAASGGYWISTYADTIVASPLTITGSIGVIGGWIWNKEFGSKIGFDYDGVKRGASADAGEGFRLPLLGVTVPDRPLTESERQRIEKMIRASYEEFVGKVAQGRGLDEKYVDSIGQGRVWSGTRGKQNGLVDEIGGLWRGLQIAKAAAGIAPNREIEILEGPKISSVDWSFLRPQLPDLPGVAEPAGLESALPEAERDFLRRILQSRGAPIYMMEPIEIHDGTPQSERSNSWR